MVRKDGAEVRKLRIKEIAKKIHAALYESANGEIFLSKTIAIIMYDTGLTKDRVWEYLQVPFEMGQFQIDEVNDKIKKIADGV